MKEPTESVREAFELHIILPKHVDELSINESETYGSNFCGNPQGILRELKGNVLGQTYLRILQNPNPAKSQGRLWVIKGCAWGRPASRCRVWVSGGVE